MNTIDLSPISLEGKNRGFLIQARLHLQDAAEAEAGDQIGITSRDDGEASTSAPSTRISPAGIIITHGAGGGMDSPHMQRYVAGLAGRGIPCVSFECRGPSLPHRSDVYEAVLAHTGFWPETQEVPGWVLAGHSMVRR